MSKKDELTEKALALGIELDSKETIADLEAKIAQAEAGGAVVPVIKRRSLNRGSRRRMQRALDRFRKDMTEFEKEMDLQVFEADKDGSRTGEWPILGDLRKFRDDMTSEVNKLMSMDPAGDDE